MTFRAFLIAIFIAVTAVLFVALPRHSVVAQPTPPITCPGDPGCPTTPTTLPGTQVTTTGPVTSETTISIGSIAAQILAYVTATFVAIVGTLLASWLRKLAARVGVEVTDQQKAQLQAIVVNGLNHGASVLTDQIKGRGQIAIKSAVVAEAVRYTQEHGAEVIKDLGLDPESELAIQAIKARAETAIADPTQPTPPVLDPPNTSKTAIVVAPTKSTKGI